MSAQLPIEITPSEVKQLLEADSTLSLIDCREPNENAFCRIDPSQLVPLSMIPEQVDELKRTPRLVVYCHHGIRSLRAATWLRRNGVVNAQSMSGGIEAWSTEIDPKVPRY